MRDHLVGVHVGRGSGACLEDVDWKLLVVVSGRHGVASARYGLPYPVIEYAAFDIREGGSAFDVRDRVNEASPETQAGYREVLERSLSLGSPEHILRDLDRSERVLFHPTTHR